jgi:hypothetical protein
MELKILSLTYNQFKEDKIRFFIDDGKKRRFITISVYIINNSWYADITGDDRELLYGKIIHTWVDLFELLKINDKDFPNIQLMAIPSNTNGINKEFTSKTAGIVQELFLVKSGG